MAGWGTVAASVLIRPHATVDAGGGLAAVDHPTGVANLMSWGLIALAVFWLAFIGRQVVSYRRAAGESRQQLKWVMYGAAITATTLVATNFYPAPSGSALAHAIGVVVNGGLVALPISMGVAIPKYRLFEIDRLISRTLSYAVVTVFLATVFIGLVLFTTRTLPLSSPVGVAASTLAAAALFNPLRTRVQRLVDRRFNRARYDAQATIEDFTSRVRDAVDLDTVQTDLVAAVVHAVQPAHASVWIKPRS